MTDPISHFGRKAQIESANRQAVGKGEPRASSPSTEASARAAAPATDELRLSSVARQAMQEPEFDRAKVEAIKKFGTTSDLLAAFALLMADLPNYTNGKTYYQKCR